MTIFGSEFFCKKPIAYNFNSTYRMAQKEQKWLNDEVGSQPEDGTQPKVEVITTPSRWLMVTSQ